MSEHKRYIEYDGKSMSISDWARKLGISSATLQYRLKHYSVEEAFTKPINEKCRQNALNRVKKDPADYAPVVKDPYKKPFRAVWRDKYEAIEDDKFYPISEAAKLTSGGTCARAKAEGQFIIHTFEGGVKRIKGYDLKQWILKLGYTLAERPKTPPQEVKVEKPKRKYVFKNKPGFTEFTITPAAPVVDKKMTVNWPVFVSLALLVGIFGGLLISYVRC